MADAELVSDICGLLSSLMLAPFGLKDSFGEWPTEHR